MKLRHRADGVTILIRTSNDYRVFDCIASIKKDSPSSEIVVSMTPNDLLEKSIQEMGIRYCIVPKKNVSITTNRGLDLVKTSRVIITDADTVFGKNCIQYLIDSLDNFDVVKPKLIYRAGVSRFGKEVANLRTFFNDTNKMYMPGLSFKKNLKNKIGDFFFNEDIIWSEDSEFSDRLENKCLKTLYMQNARLFHSPVSMSHDLADAILIGANKYKIEKLKKLPKKRLDIDRKIYRLFGFSTLVYGIVWYSFFDIGQISKKLGRVGKLIEDICWKVITRVKDRE